MLLADRLLQAPSKEEGRGTGLAPSVVTMCTANDRAVVDVAAQGLENRVRRWGVRLVAIQARGQGVLLQRFPLPVLVLVLQGVLDGRQVVRGIDRETGSAPTATTTVTRRGESAANAGLQNLYKHTRDTKRAKITRIVSKDNTNCVVPWWLVLVLVYSACCWCVGCAGVLIRGGFSIQWLWCKEILS